MAKVTVTEAGYYAGRFLKPGQSYDEDPSPEEAKAAKKALAAAEKAVAAAKMALDKADEAGKPAAEAALAAAEADLATLIG